MTTNFRTSDAKAASALCAAGFVCETDPSSTIGRQYLRFADPLAERAAAKFYSGKLRVDALRFLQCLDAVHDLIRASNRAMGGSGYHEG